MQRERQLSLIEISRELNLGISTIKYILKRFNNRLPHDLVDGQVLYSRETVSALFAIHEKIDMGMLPSEIEKELAAGTDTGAAANTPADSSIDSTGHSTGLSTALETLSSNDDIHLGNNGLSLLKSLFHDIGQQQDRIAIAHEQRAKAEERKAVAIEKRAGAEEKKAEAMNNIANALQEMNRLRTDDISTQQIVGQTAAILIEDEGLDELEDESQNGSGLDDLSQLIDDSNENQHEKDVIDTPDDLAALLDDEIREDIRVDDLAALLDDETREDIRVDDLSALIDDHEFDAEASAEPDDLSQLLGDDDFEGLEPVELLDDLSLLVGQEDTETHPDGMDDLSKLIGRDHPSAMPDLEMDDLSKLVDADTQPIDGMDDLTQLINADEHSIQPDAAMDDLSLLIEANHKEPEKVKQKTEMDELSELIDSPGESLDEAKTMPAIKIDITPEQDLGQYKAAIMKIIIGLHGDGLGVDEVTSHLNQNRIKTISGKPEWSLKAISQIYRFIESAT